MTATLDLVLDAPAADPISDLVAAALAEARAYAEQPPRYEARPRLELSGIAYSAVYDCHEGRFITEALVPGAAEEQARTWNRSVYPGWSAELKARISALSIADRQEFNRRLWEEQVSRMSEAERRRYGLEVSRG
jgi:hypothetical protein